MNRKIIFAIIFLLFIFLGVFQVSSVGQFFRIRGDFLPDPSWPLGQPGRVLFDIGPSNSGFTANIDTDGYLSGAFWLGNVGWGVFNHGDPSVPRAQINCTDEVFRDATVTCSVNGFGWSQNAGWIAFSGGVIDGGSGVYYNPATGRIEGFGHNEALGWIPFYSEAMTPITTLTQSGLLLNGVGLNFIGRIAIIGNIAGTRIFNLTNQNVGYVFSDVNHAEMLNIIRKNVALISRNINPVDLANPNDTRFNFMIQSGSDYDTRGGGWTWPSAKKSIIIIGGDVILDPSQIGLDTDTNRALIVLKDSNGNGGNIIITNNVGRIYSFLYAEGSIFSGEKSITGVIMPYVNDGVWNIPANQLYIKGALISKNTIGGSLQNPPVCPVVINDCDPMIAQVYDINYFRTYDYTDLSQRNVPYDDPRFQRASTVIEYNDFLLTDPPPGIQSIFQ